MKKKFLYFLKIVYVVADALALAMSFLLGNFIRHGLFIHPAYNRLIAPSVVICILLFYHHKLYTNFRVTYVYELFRIIRAMSVSFIIILAIMFYWRPFSYSRLMLSYFWALAVIFVFAEREILKYLLGILIKIFFQPEKVLVIGKGKIVSALRKRIKLMHQVALMINRFPDENEIANIVKRGFSGVIVAQFPVNHQHSARMADICEKLGIAFQLVPDILELKLGDMVLDEFFGIPLLKLKPTPLAGAHLFMKDVFDVAGCITVLAFLMPVLVLAAVFIKLDSPGGIIYSHTRRGKGGRDFKFFKFRTMIAGADRIFRKDREEHYKKGGLLFKLKNDSRITPVGRFLRKWSLDEFPQLYNVLKGDMSVVGPRPQIISEAKHYDDSAKRRLRIKPGITGLWQVSGRSDLSYEEMVRLDIFYVQNWSMEEDFRIILRTIPAVIFGKGAY